MRGREGGGREGEGERGRERGKEGKGERERERGGGREGKRVKERGGGREGGMHLYVDCCVLMVWSAHGNASCPVEQAHSLTQLPSSSHAVHLTMFPGRMR